MSREICVYLGFLSEEHRRKISETAEPLGFHTSFFDVGEIEQVTAFVPNCEILFSASHRALRAASTDLKWYACGFAGVTPYCADPTFFANPDCILTNSNVYGDTISEHILMVLLMLLRRMPDYQRIVARNEWISGLPIRSIRGSSVVIVGTGNIGSSTAKRLKALGAASVTGVNRSGRCDHPAFDRVLPASRLEEILPDAHILILCVPSTPESDGLLSRERLDLLPEDALLVNVGRGAAIDQNALAEALQAHRIAGAALDVFRQEPIPPEDPLRSLPNLIITPHCAGDTGLPFTQDAIVKLFCDNLRRYAAGLPLRGVVDRRRGY